MRKQSEVYRTDNNFDYPCGWPTIDRQPSEAVNHLRVSHGRAASGLYDYGHRISVIWYQTAFRWYWLSSSIQALAMGTQFLVIGWLVLEVTGSSASTVTLCTE